MDFWIGPVGYAVGRHRWHRRVIAARLDRVPVRACVREVTEDSDVCRTGEDRQLNGSDGLGMENAGLRERIPSEWFGSSGGRRGAKARRRFLSWCRPAISSTVSY